MFGKKIVTAVAFFVVTMVSMVALAAPQRIEGTGEAVMGETDTPVVVKRVALDSAYQDAVEQAGVMIINYTEVKQGLITDDDIKAISGAIVNKVKGSDRYEPIAIPGAYMKLKAYVLVDVDTDKVDLDKYLEDKKKDKTANEELIRMQKEIERLNQQNQQLMEQYSRAQGSEKKELEKHIEENCVKNDMFTRVNTMVYDKEFEKASVIVNQTMSNIQNKSAYDYYITGIAKIFNNDFAGALSDLMIVETLPNAGEYMKSHYYRGMVYYRQHNYKAAYQELNYINKMTNGTDEDVRALLTLTINKLTK